MDKHQRKARHRSMRQSGFCTQCGCDISDPVVRGNSWHCRDCATALAARKRSVRDARKDAGLCTECGKPSPQFRRCEECRALKREQER